MGAILLSSFALLKTIVRRGRVILCNRIERFENNFTPQPDCSSRRDNEGARPCTKLNGHANSGFALMWQKGQGGKQSWDTPVRFAKSLSHAGCSDWRLPSKAELFSLSRCLGEGRFNADLHGFQRLPEEELSSLLERSQPRR